MYFSFCRICSYISIMTDTCPCYLRSFWVDLTTSWQPCPLESLLPIHCVASLLLGILSCLLFLQLLLFTIMVNVHLQVHVCPVLYRLCLARCMLPWKVSDVDLCVGKLSVGVIRLVAMGTERHIQ